MKGERRYRLLRFLRKLFKIEEGWISPWYLKIIAYTMFPSRIIWDLNPWFKYDISTDTLTIEKHKISVQFLIDLVYNIPENRWFRIKDRKNAGMTMETEVCACDYQPQNFIRKEFRNGLSSDPKDERSNH